MTDKHSENSVFRILDAAINRAGEGLRVVEDHVRMVLADAFLSRQFKQLRHDLTFSVRSIDPIQRVQARDSVGDVGRTIETETEYIRRDPHEPSVGGNVPAGGLIQANLARAQQALRTIEEFSKTIDPTIAKNVEQLRYRTYTLEKAVLTTVVSRNLLGNSRLYVLIDGGDATSTENSRLRMLVEQLVAAEVGLIQLRDKSLTDRQQVETGRMISKLTRSTNTRFIMNDRADLALAANADGVHLGQDDIQVSDARRIVGAAKMIGVSTHSLEQARQAVLEGANYIGVGPVFPSQTKQFDAHVGLELVAAVAREVQLPAFAIGGIHQQNVADVVRSGMSRIAVSAAVANATDPEAAARDLILALSGSVEPSG